MVMDLDRMLPILRCPSSGTAISRKNDHLISATGLTYPIVNGIPVIVKNVLPIHLNPPTQSQISKNSQEFTVGEQCTDGNAVIVHLGSGDIPCYDKRVISMDILPTSNVDLVAEAEALPFQNSSIDRVVSGAVFEHVYDPMRSISEVRRVLKDGGTFYIDTAFMQGYHGFPSHYFNMTPQAIETYIVDDFILENSHVPPFASVVVSIHEIFNRFLGNLPKRLSDELLNLPLGQVLERFKGDFSQNNIYVKGFSEYSHRCLAASFAVAARKPVGYDQKSLKNAEALTQDGWATLKRDYYATRMAVMMRHHEIQLYKMFVVDNGNYQPKPPVPEERALRDVLHKGHISDPMSIKSWQTAISTLKSYEEEFQLIRDRWIIEYMSHCM